MTINESFFNSNTTKGNKSMKKIFSIVLAVAIAAACSTAALATGTGGIPVGYPVLTVGYTNGGDGLPDSTTVNKGWQFKAFLGTPALFSLAQANLQTEDQGSTTVLANTLNGSSNVSKTAVTGKTMAILNHASSFTLYPLQATSPFPSIWVKGDTVNSATGADAPTTYLSGTDANKFFQTGLAIQAPYWEAANYQWTVYVFSDKDLLTQTAGAATGTIQDPNVATMRWYSWCGDDKGVATDPTGTPKRTWGYKESGASAPVMFNTLPLIASSATAAAKKTFLTGTTGASLAPAAIPGVAQSAIPANGVIHYNTDRNIIGSTNANGFTLVGTDNTKRHQIGLVYAAPNSALCHRTEILHMQFMAVWPTGIGVSTGSKSADISFYQRTAN